MSTRSKQLVKLLVRILITTGLLIWVFSQINLEQFWQTVKTARWHFLIAVWILTVVFFWINSIKFRLILKKQGCDADVTTIFGASAVTALYGMIVPGILSTVAKWYILRKDTGKGSSVLSSMLYNQLSIIVVMTACGLIALMITNPASLLQDNAESQSALIGLPVVCGILLVAIILISLLLLSSRTGGRITKALMPLLRPFPNKIRQKAQMTLRQIESFQTAGIPFHLTIASITIIDGLGVGVLIYILAAGAANVYAPLGVLVWLWAIIYILARVPISVANLGVREVTLVGFLTIYGVEKSAALLMSMILFSTSVFMAIIGAIYLIFRTASSKRSAKPRGNETGGTQRN